MRTLLTLFFLTPAAGLAQAGRAELFGTVTDSSGAAVQGARLRAEEQATQARFETLSDARGEYHLLGLPHGEYVLTAGQDAFRSHRQTGILLRAGDRVAIDLTLELGPRSESIEVTSRAPLLETAGGDVSFHLGQRRITALPLDGRNLIPLVALAPGVALPSGSLLPRINGSRPRTNEYLYDGVSVLQPEPGQVAWYPIPDGVEEVRLNINSYSPEYGRSNGGTVMVIGKSGTNELHGTLFEFLRNEALNARNYFAPAGPKPEFRRNQYGAVLGGPVERNRTFFFADWQGTRLRTGITRFSTVPTLAQRQGIFSGAVFDPATSPRQQFANNTIPASRFDPLGQQVLARYPLPNLPGTANNYVRTAAEPDNQDQFDTRLDRTFGSRHRVFGRYTYLRDDDTPVTPLPDGSGSLTSGVIGHAITRGDGAVAEHAWTPSPTTLNQARFGYSRRDLNQASLQTGGLSVPGIPANSFASVLPIFTVAGYQQIGPTAAANSNFTTSMTEFLDTFSMVRGRHTVKFGADLRREAADVLNPPNPTGSFTFNTTGTNSSTAASGNSLASLLLGQVNAFSIDIQKDTIQARAHIAEFFLADDWRVSSRLTVNIGTRYTLNFPSTIVGNRGAVFNLNTQALDFPHTARELECCDFGPRVGLAWRAGDRWVIRSGYGMVWFEQTGITTPFTIPQFPFVQTVGQQSQDNIAPAFPLSAGPSIRVTDPNPNSGLGQGVFGADRHNGSGYSQQWNFSVERAFGKDTQVAVTYLGSKNTRLGIPDANLNQLSAGYLGQGAALLQRVPNPYYGSIPASSSLGAATITSQQLLRAFPRFTTVALFRDNVGNSSYEAVAARIEKRFSRGLTFTASYTFSKLIDDASSVFSQTIFTGPVLNNTGAADAFNRHLEKDLSSGDIPRVFSAGWSYQIPRWWKFSGWQIAGIVRVQSGDTVAVTQATNLDSNLGFAVQRPDRAANPNDFAARSAARWFDTTGFRQAPQFVIGNSPRNPVRGPGLQNADLMVAKTFALGERWNLEVRAEGFNVANTPPLADPNGSFGSAAFGSITSAGNPRVFEFAAKVRF